MEPALDIAVLKATSLALSEYRKKATRPRALGRQKLARRKFQPSMRRAIASWMKDVRTIILERNPKTGAEVDALPWATMERWGTDLIGPIQAESWKYGYTKFRPKRFVKQDEEEEAPRIRTDVIGEKAKRYASVTGSKMIKEITKETRQAVRETIVMALDRGWGPAKTARILYTNIGLTRSQAAAVGNNWTRMLEAGIDEARAEAAAVRYAQHLQLVRSETIARTEINNALREGIIETMSEQGIERVIWVADPECCEICAEYDGEEYTIDEYEEIMNPHPNCECTMVMA